ncbi:hypothetical protein C8J56DRAFT_184113 [Mycena floridula]|nr:hypothetical protein C8J56DRAFT_184113 [Mycena floridula]
MSGHALPSADPSTSSDRPLEWNWEVEHEDRKREAKADAALHGSTPFQVDRKVLKDVVREKAAVDVVRITFLSSGTFHKAYLVTLADGVELVARVARRFMPRLKTESEVATIQFLRENTNVPVPTVYHYDSNPYNRLGGEYILMSKAPGIPLAQVYHSLSYSDLSKLLSGLAEIVISLFAHRFTKLGSLYFGPDPENATSTAATPKAVQMHYSAFPFSPTLSMSNVVAPKKPRLRGLSSSGHHFHVGPIISWPFFGSNRGELTHPNEINRGPWSTSQSYFASCVQREVTGANRENEGKAAPHRLHLDPDEINSSRHHRVKAVPGDQSDDSDEWDLEESEDEWEGPGDGMYRDYRRMQRSTFLVAHINKREQFVKQEMQRWIRIMERLTKALEKEKGKPLDEPETFGLDCHDLSLENIFVDANEPHKITCIIDWESTTTRPLWACAHLPAFLQTSPFTAKIFRDVVQRIASDSTSSVPTPTMTRKTKLDGPSLAREWLHYESHGVRLRMAHRCVEWDGWEEGLVESMLGPEEFEDDWFRDVATQEMMSPFLVGDPAKGVGGIPKPNDIGAAVRKAASKLPFAKEMVKEDVLNTTGDICGGRGGELGRRLEAWLTVTGPTDPDARLKRWAHEEEGSASEIEVS